MHFPLNYHNITVKLHERVRHRILKKIIYSVFQEKSKMKLVIVFCVVDTQSVNLNFRGLQLQHLYMGILHKIFINMGWFCKNKYK